MRQIVVGLMAVGLTMGTARAAVVTIQSTDALWNYATIVAGDGSTTPSITAITPGSGQTLTFSSVTGLVSLSPGYTYGPDGGNSSPPGASPLNVSAAAGLSGIVSYHSAFLAGVFLNGNEASSGHVSPATLTFSNFSFSSLSPLDDQVFFIGDGLTDSGSHQTFVVPSDATELVLGIADAYGYSGPPGAYYDNSGSFTATFAISGQSTAPTGVPEPTTWSLMMVGLVAARLFQERRRSPA